MPQLGRAAGTSRKSALEVYTWPPTLLEGLPTSVHISVPQQQGVQRFCGLHVQLEDESLDGAALLDVSFPTAHTNCTQTMTVLVDPRETGAGHIRLKIAATPAEGGAGEAGCVFVHARFLLMLFLSCSTSCCLALLVRCCKCQAVCVSMHAYSWGGEHTHAHTQYSPAHALHACPHTGAHMRHSPCCVCTSCPSSACHQVCVCVCVCVCVWTQRATLSQVRCVYACMCVYALVRVYAVLCIVSTLVASA